METFPERTHFTTTYYTEVLQVLDFLQAGMTHRQIANKLYGEEEVEREWYDGSWIRGRVRRRIKKAKYFVNGGYKDLLINK